MLSGKQMADDTIRVAVKGGSCGNCSANQAFGVGSPSILLAGSG
jgi:hypothetical protein